MNDIAIRIEGLGKQYPRHLGAFSIAQRLRQANGADWFWAIQDISAEIRRGETIALVGHNGAGKTTLLRILSRLTRPTTGRAQIFGRVGALLEVGSGFHAELTGRENIYLNGALLGMTEGQVRARFDAIIEFSGLSEAVDTPFKWYSSGMRARLGFSIAAHLDSDILLIDEALAVGDAAFRQRGAERIRALIRSNRTVILTGHQHSLISPLCERALWIEHGRMRGIGAAEAILKQYLDAEKVSPVTPHRDLPSSVIA